MVIYGNKLYTSKEKNKRTALTKKGIKGDEEEILHWQTFPKEAINVIIKNIFMLPETQLVSAL
jgi:hypothetical protein